MSSFVDIVDNTKEALAAIKKAKQKGLEKCGLKAEGYAKKNLTANKSVDTGNLRNSITHKVAGNDAYIGTNVEYAPYVEFGTGIYASKGTSAKEIPWVYQDSGGNWHRTKGSRPKPYLRPAASEHGEEYKQIIKDALKNE